jgi:predicted DNA-binding transcriptional regulator AlpA
VVSESEAAEIVGLSIDTLRRSVRDGDGPARIKLSERRVGYRRSAWPRGWISGPCDPAATSMFFPIGGAVV